MEHGKTNGDLENHKALLVCPLSFFVFFYPDSFMACFCLENVLVFCLEIKYIWQLALLNSHAAWGWYWFAVCRVCLISDTSVAVFYSGEYFPTCQKVFSRWDPAWHQSESLDTDLSFTVVSDYFERYPRDYMHSFSKTEACVKALVWMLYCHLSFIFLFKCCINLVLKSLNHPPIILHYTLT